MNDCPGKRRQDAGEETVHVPRTTTVQEVCMHSSGILRENKFNGKPRITGQKTNKTPLILTSANFTVQVYWTLTVQEVCMHT